MTINISVDAYDAFKGVINGLQLAGTVFESVDATIPWWTAAIIDNSRGITVVMVTPLASAPSAFAADFPNAVTLSGRLLSFSV